MNNVTTVASGTWVSNNMKGLDAGAFKDPGGANGTLVATPAVHAYAYAVSPTGCDNTGTNLCTSYVLTATLDNGTSTYVKNSLN
jgi:hypothetical protein